MNPQTGRFLGMDTFEGDQEDPLSLHKYAFVKGDGGVNGSDPSGNMTFYDAMWAWCRLALGSGALQASEVGIHSATTSIEVPQDKETRQLAGIIALESSANDYMVGSGVEKEAIGMAFENQGIFPTKYPIFAKSFKQGGYALTAGNLWKNIWATSTTVRNGHINWIFSNDDWKDVKDIDPRIGTTHLKLSVVAALNVMHEEEQNPNQPIASHSLTGTQIPIFFHAAGAREPYRQNLTHVGTLATTVFIGPVAGYYQKNFNP